jgi:catechol 2,3-dioxygenase-like lactoylglutathione lyase family enzyme
VILDHIKVNVTDLARSRAFFTAALAPLGVVEIWEGAFGRDRKPELFLRQAERVEPMHIAFAAGHDAVDAFHAAALAAGGTDNGAPGPRDYHPRYYGAFVLDPDGHNVEAVSHAG